MITGADIMAMAQEYGFEHAAFLSCDTIVPLEEVRWMCAADACGKYGKNWSCPPACGSLEECAERIRSCKDGILVQTVGELEDSMDVESMLETEQRHKRRFENMQEALAAKLPRLLALGSGCCTRCETCTYPEQACRFPKKLISSMEAYGILVSDLCKRNGLAYYYGADRIAYTSCFLWDDEIRM